MEKARGITAINSTSALKKDEEGLRNVATETAPLIFYGLNVGKKRKTIFRRRPGVAARSFDGEKSEFLIFLPKTNRDPKQKSATGCPVAPAMNIVA